MTPNASRSPGGSESSAGAITTPVDSSSPSVHTTPPSQEQSTRLIPLRPLSKPPADRTRSKDEEIKDSSDKWHFEDSDEDLELDELDTMGRPPTHRQPNGLAQPLLQESKDKDANADADGRGRGVGTRTSQRPPFAGRRDTFRSRSPTYSQPEDLTRRKYIYAAFFLVLSLISFVVQTETAVYIQHELHWDKAYCMLWLTHGSWSLLWPVQLLILRTQKRKMSWSTFWRQHVQQVRSTAQMVQSQDLYLSATTTTRGPWRYMIKTTAGVTTFLTMAGGSWYVAVNLTTPSDLTAIYNCSAFFAYVFSILLLNDKIRFDKIFSVGLAILGVLVVAYGDSGNPKHGSHSGGATNPNHDEDSVTNTRTLGNLIIGIGSVMYGLYEVLYKKYACPPEGTSPGRGMVFANTFGSMVGVFTLCVLWIPMPVLHYLDIERFELPRGQAAWLLAVSTLSNAVFSGSFLVLMSLTSPVLSSVAALLTIFLVAIVDWFRTGEPPSMAAIAGGTLIVIAFAMLSWATYREMKEDEKRRDKDESKSFDATDSGDLPYDDADEEDVDELGRRQTG